MNEKKGQKDFTINEIEETPVSEGEINLEQYVAKMRESMHDYAEYSKEAANNKDFFKWEAIISGTVALASAVGAVLAIKVNNSDVATLSLSAFLVSIGFPVGFNIAAGYGAYDDNPKWQAEGEIANYYSLKKMYNDAMTAAGKEVLNGLNSKGRSL